VSTGIPGKDGKPDIPTYEATEWHYQDMGIFNVGGPNWIDGKHNLAKGCKTFGEGWCAYFTMYPHGIYGGDGQVFAIQDQMHWDFNYIQNRFQEFAPDYIKGDVITPLIPIETIDKVPIAFIASTLDQICPYVTAQHLNEVIPAVTSFHTMEDVDHFYYSYASDEKLMGNIVHELENIVPLEAETEFLQ